MLTFLHRTLQILVLTTLGGMAAHALAAETTPAQQLSQWSVTAGQPGRADQGRQHRESHQAAGARLQSAGLHGQRPR